MSYIAMIEQKRKAQEIIKKIEEEKKNENKTMPSDNKTE